MRNYAQMSAVNIVKSIKDNRVSTVELLEYYIERFERLNPSINAIVTTDFENARIRARKSDEALRKGENWGPLHGLPMTIKDGIEVVGMPCSFGSPMFKDYMPSENADVVQPLVDAGAIIFGKTNLPPLAMNTQTFNDVYGQTNNPWDVSRTPGGSSGGSAAALAAGLTGLEIGSDQGGSIRSPAHFCGVYGHKPSYGIVPMHGQIAPIDIFQIDYPVELDFAVTGPLARSPEDLDLVMNLIVRPPRSQRKAYKIELPPPRKKALSEYRIGLWIDDPIMSTDTEVGDCLQKLVDNLSKAGAIIEEKKPDIDVERCFQVISPLNNMSTAFNIPEDDFNRMLQEVKKLDKNDNSNNARRIREITKPHREWLLLDIERSMMRQKWSDYFQEFDVMLCPAVRIPAFPHDKAEFAKRFTRFNDQELPHEEVIAPWAALIGAAYLPATVAPAGLSSNGLPVGVQIVGAFLEDRTPIHFAKLLEKINGSFKLPPGFN